jgi:arylsulfatase A-like enzyme
MNRRTFLKNLAMGVAGLVSNTSVSSVGESARRRPDVLFIAIDDMNDWTTLFDAKNPIKTPNLVRLAKRGMFFTKAYCAAPACCPSRAAIMTGIRPSNSGVYENNHAWAEMMPDAVTLSRYFMLNGYETFGAGKIFHHGRTGADIPGKPSFQEFFKLRFTKRAGRNLNGYRKRPLSKRDWDWGETQERMGDLDTVEWCEKVMEREKSSPRFLAAGIFKPHLPFYAPPANFKKYPFEDTILPEMKKDDLDDVSQIAKKMAHTEYFIFSNTTAKPENDPGSLKRMVQCYQASADFADQMVGRLLDKLDSTGQTENTIIILWADHGYHLGDKESCVKFTLWEKANRVPFLIVAPGVTKPGSRCDRPVSLIDIYPTLVELASLPPKKDLDGKSLVPLLKDPRRQWQPALMTMGRGNHAVRSDRWRYIQYSDGSNELYDHSKDPWEWTNLARRAEYADVIDQHKKCLPKNEK